MHGDCMISYCISPCFHLCPRLPPTPSLHQLSPQSFPRLLSCWSLWMDANTYPPLHTAQAARNAHLLKCQSGETHLSHPTSYLQFFYGSPQLSYKIQHPQVSQDAQKGWPFYASPTTCLKTSRPSKGASHKLSSSPK